MDLAQQRFPRLVLLDLMMPEVDGYTVAEQLRSNPHTRGLPRGNLLALVDNTLREQHGP